MSDGQKRVSLSVSRAGYEALRKKSAETNKPMAALLENEIRRFLGMKLREGEMTRPGAGPRAQQKCMCKRPRVGFKGKYCKVCGAVLPEWMTVKVSDGQKKLP